MNFSELSKNWIDGKLSENTSAGKDSTADFEKHEAATQKYEEKNQIQSRLTLQREVDQQNRLDGWKEFYIYKHQGLSGLERNLH